MTHHRDQLGGEIRRAVQEVLARGLNDPRLSGLITVTKATISGDEKRVTVEVSVLPEEREPLVLHALRHAAAHIRRRVGDMVFVKVMPEMVFKVDSEVKKQAALLDALTKVRREREERGPREGKNDPPSPTPGASDGRSEPEA